jgi:hypothetical protein
MNHVSSALVGKVMKRMELFDDRVVLRKEVKELIYEQFRHFKDLLIAHSAGLELVKVQFMSRGPNSKSEKTT